MNHIEKQQQAQQRFLVYLHAERFLNEISELAVHGIKNEAPVLIQPIALLRLINAARAANEIMGAVSKYEEFKALQHIEDSIQEIALLYRQKQEQKTDEPKPAHP